MTLLDLGWEAMAAHQEQEAEAVAEGFLIGRITSEQKEHYLVQAAVGEFDAEITGNLRYAARGPEDFPAVGDWVAISDQGNGFAIIHRVLARYSLIKRRAIDSHGDIQVIATNVDYAIIVQGADRDFNLNRIERYLTMCHDSSVMPIIVVTKTDLFGEAQMLEMEQHIRQRQPDVSLVLLSNLTMAGYERLGKLLAKGQTYCLLGSSGAGKSTLINNLAQRELMKTAGLSPDTNKGRHTTSHRQLFVLDSGEIIIDNPGMRELGMADGQGGLDMTFARIHELSGQCRFGDCTHTGEKGCAVLQAIQDGELEPVVYDNYLKLEKEKQYFESTRLEKRQKAREFSRMVKNFKKDQRQQK